MKEKLKEYIKSKKTKILTLSEIYNYLNLPYLPENDKIIYNLTKQLKEEKCIQPLKTAKRNRQGSFEKFKILIQNEEEIDKIKKEILKLNSNIKIDYLLKHLEEYKKNKEIIIPINNFIQEALQNEKQMQSLTVNERSYQIYKNEKLLKENENLLKKLGLTFQDLYAYDTYEPFFYYINEEFKNQERVILIIENKDTFWTIVKNVQKLKLSKIYMVIYGEGKKIINSFSYIKELNISNNDVFKYFGDIDYEGINIYETLKEKFRSYNISAYKTGYETILDIENNPKNLRASQNINNEKISKFIKEFSVQYQDKLINIFNNKKFIPQEVFNNEVAGKKMKEGGAH